MSRFRKNTKARAGFTGLEVLIALVVIGAIGIGAWAYNRLQTIKEKTTSPFDVEQQVQPAAPAPSTETSQPTAAPETPAPSPIQELIKEHQSLRQNPPSAEDLKNIYRPSMQSRCEGLLNDPNFTRVAGICEQYGVTGPARSTEPASTISPGSILPQVPE